MTKLPKQFNPDCALAGADLHICKGNIFSQIFVWQSNILVYKPITAITKAAPPVITATSHGLTNQWPVSVASVLGMTEINALETPPSNDDRHQATVLSSNTISLNDVNALDFHPYKSGGTLIYNSPVDLTTASIYMAFLTKKGGTEIAATRLTEGSGITVDNTFKTITAEISATDTDLLPFTKAYYLLFDDTSGLALFEGSVTVDNLIL